jgi:hypothetical protein
MEGTCAVETVKAKKQKVEEFSDIPIALGKYGLQGDVEKILTIYGMRTVREFPHILNASMLKAFKMEGSLQQYNEIYRDARKAAQMIGDDSMLAWELFSEEDLLKQDAIRLERQGSSKAFCAICGCVKAQCVEKESHFGIFDSSPPRLHCFYCAAIFCGMPRFRQRERHQMLCHFTR